jgi:hypothetical protein
VVITRDLALAEVVREVVITLEVPRTLVAITEAAREVPIEVAREVDIVNAIMKMVRAKRKSSPAKSTKILGCTSLITENKSSTIM